MDSFIAEIGSKHYLIKFNQSLKIAIRFFEPHITNNFKKYMIVNLNR